ncbi:hypothetical protein MSZK_45270 [Mycobacterium sp. shizuoka-1]|nr:hypothetical protein MSZK_45270 [Mycobacterium sp. shizuoka-1]
MCFSLLLIEVPVWGCVDEYRAKTDLLSLHPWQTLTDAPPRNKPLAEPRIPPRIFFHHDARVRHIVFAVLALALAEHPGVGR